jgi:hypothetical protein
MIVQHAARAYPAGAVQRPQTHRDTPVVSMGTPATMSHPKVETDVPPPRTPRVSHAVEASLSKLSPSG